MSDILSTRSVGENLGPRPQGGATASPVATVVVADASFKLPTLTVGTMITGVVAEQAARGNVVIQTDKGNLTIQSKVPLKVGNTVILQLQSVGVQSRVVILSVDGQPIGGSAMGGSAMGGLENQPLAAGRGGPTNATLAASPQTQANQSSSPHLSGREAPSTPAGSNPTTGPSTNTPANPIAAEAASGARGNPGLSRSPLTNGLVLPAQVLEASALGSGAASGGGGSRAGDILTVRVLATAAAGSAQLEPQVPPQTDPKNWLRAAVVSNGPTGATPNLTASSSGSGPNPQQGLILATADSRLAVSAAPPGPEGTRVLLEIISHSAQRAERIAAALDSQKTFVRLAGEWASLKEVVGLLDTTGAQNAASPIQPSLPAPGATLASTILFFLSALKGGDYRNWLGRDNVSQLESGQQGQLLTRLGDDFVQLGRLASEPQPSGWQVMLVPIAHGDGLEQIRMYYRRQQGSEGNSDDLASRFIVEAELSRFGPVQLDGLIRPGQFDLVLRSDIEFATNMQSDIRTIFQSALEVSGHNGGVRFERRSGAAVDLFPDEATETTYGSSVIV
jgi:hypothetical protein